MLNYRHL